MAQVSKKNNAHLFSKLAHDRAKSFEMETSERLRDDFVSVYKEVSFHF
jgi:hypothetical protein